MQRDRFIMQMLSGGIVVRPLRRPPLGKKARRRGKQDTHQYDNQPDLRPAVLDDYNRRYWRYANRA